MKVVSKHNSSASAICQNPELAPSLLEHVAPVSRASVSSTLEIG